MHTYYKILQGLETLVPKYQEYKFCCENYQHPSDVIKFDLLQDLWDSVLKNL